MNTRSKKLALGIAVALATPSIALAEGFYATGQLAFSEQANDSRPIGQNIAADPDFPGKFDAGDATVGGIGIGYKVSEQFRIEGRISHRDSSFNDRQIGTGARDGEEYILNGALESTTFTVEGFYDFANESSFTPYVKAGVGVSDNSYSARLGGAGVAAFDPFDGVTDGYYDAYADGDSTEFSWNVGVGGNFDVSDSVSFYGEYQYVSFGDVSTGQDAFTDGFEIEDAAANEFVLGIRISF
ncbi:MAG: outer membrane beta-barrel protein [Gammaproteobacteria bacterium]|nr:outer membrane beta-barrel protein [Gammaproteobacteria bacterium]